MAQKAPSFALVSGDGELFWKAFASSSCDVFVEKS